MKRQTIFITGTDTGVGKTILTALFVRYLRKHGYDAVALKPISTGERTDAATLYNAQDGVISIEEINPFHFSLPAAPWLAASKCGCCVKTQNLIRAIKTIQEKFPIVLVEGVGGLLVPLNSNTTVRDLIRKLKCHVIVVGFNRLGVLNHTLMTVECLRRVRPLSITIVLMNPEKPGCVEEQNPTLLRKLLPNTPVVNFPHLPKTIAGTEKLLVEGYKFCKKTLADLASVYKFRSGSLETIEERVGRTLKKK